MTSTNSALFTQTDTTYYTWANYRCAYQVYNPVNVSKVNQTPLLLIHPIGVGLSGWFWQRFWPNDSTISRHKDPIVSNGAEAMLERMIFQENRPAGPTLAAVLGCSDRSRFWVESDNEYPPKPSSNPFLKSNFQGCRGFLANRS